MEGHTTVTLEPIDVPMLVEEGPLTPVLLGARSLRAQGRAALTPGTFAFDTGEIVTFKPGTVAQFECELTLRTESSAEGGVLVWPTIDRFSATFSEDVEVVQPEGPPAAVGGFDLEEEPGKPVVQKKVHVELGRTMGLALARLATQKPTATPVEDPFGLVQLLSVPQMDVELEAGAELDIEGQRLKVDGGSLGVRDLVASRADELVAGRVLVHLQLGEGTELAHQGLSIRPGPSRLLLDAFVEHRGGQLEVVAGGTVEGHGLHVSSATVELPDGHGTLQIGASRLSVRQLSMAPTGLAVSLDGVLELGSCSVDWGPLRVVAEGGRVGSFAANLDPDPSGSEVFLSDVRFEGAQVGVLEGDHGFVELQADTLAIPKVSTSADSVLVVAAGSTLKYVEGGRELVASSKPATTLTLESPLGLMLGQPVSADGLRLSANWERLQVDFGAEPLVVEPAGVELRVLKQEPLELEASVHAEHTHLGGLEQALAPSSLRLQLNERTRTGTIALSLRVPFGFVSEAVQSQVPDVVDIGLPEAAVEAVLAVLRVERDGLIGRLLSHVAVHFEVTGHHALVLGTRDDALRVSGEVALAAVAKAKVGQYAATVARLRPTATVDEVSGEVELVRRTFTVPVVGTLKATTSAPCDAAALKLQLQPSFEAPSGHGAAIDALAGLLAEELGRRPLEVELAPLLEPQLASAIESAKVIKGRFEPESTGLQVMLEVEVSVP